MRSCRIILSDHYGTTFYFSMALNIPYLAHWGTFPVLKFDNAEILDALKKTGVIHDSPRRAAHFLNNRHSIDDWWFSGEVQSIRDIFVKEYFLTSSNCLREWFRFLRAC